jgi:hypothetical protein
MWWNIVQNHWYQLILPLKLTPITNHSHSVAQLTLIHLWATSYRVCVSKTWKSAYKLQHSRYESVLMVSVPLYSVCFIYTHAQFCFSILRYTLWYLIDLTNRTFYIVFKDLCNMSDDDWYQSQHIALKRNVLCWHYCVFIRCEPPKHTTDELIELLFPFQ